MSLTIAIALFVTVAMIAVFWDNRPRSKYKVRYGLKRSVKVNSGLTKKGNGKP